jgi:hypothetical protein
MFLISSLFPAFGKFFRELAIPQRLDDLIAKIKVPQNPVARFFFCAMMELTSFFIIATNFRALAKGFIVWTVITDGLIVLQSTVINKLQIENEKARSGSSILAFTIGGMGGSALCIILTRHLWGS